MFRRTAQIKTYDVLNILLPFLKQNHVAGIMARRTLILRLFLFLHLCSI